MATRTIFVPMPQKLPYVDEVAVEFVWYPGFSVAQAQRSIASLHQRAAAAGIEPILEISSKSPKPIGVKLSAFNLRLEHSGDSMSVECAFQGSKVFEHGGPYADLYSATSREAKRDPRIRGSGKVVGFRFHDLDFPIQPVTAFYDWLYLRALTQNPELAKELVRYQGFSDIAFNPSKSLNCQARSAALYVALAQMGQIDRIAEDAGDYLALVTGGLSGRDTKARKEPGQMRMPW